MIIMKNINRSIFVGLLIFGMMTACSILPAIGPTPIPIYQTVQVTQIVTQVIPVTEIVAIAEVIVSANGTWQDTHIDLKKGWVISIDYVSGKWTYNKDKIKPFDALGSATSCIGKDCCEPLASSPKGSLLGKVENSVFYIGKGGKYNINTEGRLYLRMNDCDDQLSDNDGYVIIDVLQSPP